MDRSFDLVALLKQQPTTKSHKIRPTQFVSVAGGVQKRLETNIKNRKSSRLSVFDRIRNISKCESPKAQALSDAQQKALHRKQQLEKWKEEKDKKKKEAAALKKKPFVAGVSQRKSFGPAPPLKPMPSTSGRVTRSQARQKIDAKQSKTTQTSFAPSNASFKPPQFLNRTVPTLALMNKKKPTKPTIVTFEPVLPKTLQKVEPRSTRARPIANKPTTTAADNNSRKPNEKAKAKLMVPSQKPAQLRQNMFQSSSSSSDMEQKICLRTKTSPRKSPINRNASKNNDTKEKTKLKSKPSQRKSPVKQALQSSSSSDMEEKKLKSKPSERKSIKERAFQNSDMEVTSKTSLRKPIKENAFQSSSSSDMEEKKLRSKTSERKSIKGKAFQNSLSSDMEVSNTSLRKSPIKENAYQSSSSSDMEVMISQGSPAKQDAFQTSSSSDMEQNQSESSERKSISMAQEPEPMSQDSASTSQDSASSQDSVAMLSPHTNTMQDELSTPRNKVPKSESSSEEKLRSPKDFELTPEQMTEVVKNISPCVTLSRGKDNARKEMKKKLEEGLLDEDNSYIESVNHFRRQLDSEISRMTAMCEVWDQISAQTVLPEPVQELVLTAVGQARLLMSQKLQQFAVLVESCARPQPGGTLVTPADLHGFWDMVFMQVENIDVRFKKLEELRLANWIEEKQPSVKKVAKPQAKKVAAKPRGGPSRLRDMIAAARKAKKVQESQSETSGSDNSEATPVEVKTFEAGFFSVTSPLKLGSSGPATPSNKSSLLKCVLSSEAKKSISKQSASFAMLRASLKSKHVDIEGVSPLMQTPTMPPVNLDATPARSILKQTNPMSSKKPDKIKTVLFHSDAEVPSSPVSYVSCKSPEQREQSVAGVAPLSAEKENQPTPRRRSRLSRQNAEDELSRSPVMTRSRRKSAQTPLLETRAHNTNTEPRELRPRSDRKTQDSQDTPKRSTRRRKSAAVV